MNKKKFLAPLAFFSAFLLASCSTTTIVSRPTWEGEQIVEKDLKDNTMKKIYDAIKELGDTNSNVLNSILHKISVKYYGQFAFNTNNDISTFANKSFEQVKNDENFKKFVSEHEEAYGCKVDFKVINKEKKPLEEVDKLQVAYENIKNIYNQIIEDSYKAIYTEITGGTYSKNSLFNENKYVTNNLFKNMYIKLDALEEFRKKPQQDIELPPKKLGETYKEYVSKYITIENDESSENKLYSNYFSRKLIPDVFRTLLIQNYVKTQRTSTLGRSYARKVSMITVPGGGVSYTGKVGELFNNFVRDNIINKEKVEGNKYDFSLIEECMRGYVGTDTTKGTAKMLEDAGFQKIMIAEKEEKAQAPSPLKWNYLGDETKSTYVYYGTELGNLVEKYMKIYDIERDASASASGHIAKQFKAIRKEKIDETAFNDLTGTSAHTVEEGLTYKEREINKKTYTKDGWYLKNGGLTDLNSTYRDRLFNIETSNLIDTETPTSYESGDYVRYYNVEGSNRAFLTYQSVQTQSDESTLVIKDGTNYSIIEVQEAVSNSKFSTNQGSYYYKKGGDVKSIIEFNKIQNDVVIETSKGDTYKKNANQFYLMISNIIIHDQSMYDYLKGQYPDLFNN